jgi:6-phosphofructokinase
MGSRFRIAINTGGGDAPGLNAVIYAVTMAAHGRGWEVHGIQQGYAGLFDASRIVPLTPERVSGILAHGGTIEFRGGSPTTWDRLLALRFGAAAVRFIAEGQRDVMVAWQPPDMKAVPIVDVIGKTKQVPVESDTIQTCRDLGISLGD